MSTSMSVRAGYAVILGSNSHDTRWPGRHFIWYQLLDGSHAGDVVYVAEHLTHLLPAGAQVRAGQRIAVALPGGTGTEWGWGEPDGATRANPCYHEGQVTHSGRGDGSLHEVSWGAGPGPARSWIRWTVRQALLNA